MCFLRVALKKVFGHRYDGYPTLPYYHASDLGLNEEKFTFKTEHGWNLSGSRYFKKDGGFIGVIVFFHGLGDGRASYIKTISLLAEKGYLVYAYDNTGCMESEGRQIYSLEHSAIDQECFFKWLDNDPKAKGLKRYALGHSWGGYGAAISAKDEYHIEKVVDIAGFDNPLDIALDTFSKPLTIILRPFMWIALKSLCPKYGCLSSSKVLSKSSAKVLYIQGDEDKDVTPKQGYESLHKKFGSNPRFKWIFVKGRKHSVYKSKDAEDYVSSIISKGILSPESKENIEMDIKRATNENKELWEEIFGFLAE